jgi:hypothetical protein
MEDRMDDYEDGYAEGVERMGRELDKAWDELGALVTLLREARVHVAQSKLAGVDQSCTLLARIDAALAAEGLTP